MIAIFQIILNCNWEYKQLNHTLFWHKKVVRWEQKKRNKVFQPALVCPVFSYKIWHKCFTSTGKTLPTVNISIRKNRWSTHQSTCTDRIIWNVQALNNTHKSAFTRGIHPTMHFCANTIRFATYKWMENILKKYRISVVLKKACKKQSQWG